MLVVDNGKKDKMLKQGITAVMQKADEILYEVKNSGRNNIIKIDL